MTDFNQETPMDVYPVRLTAAHARKAREIGEENVSKGVRTSIEIAVELHETIEASKASSMAKGRKFTLTNIRLYLKYLTSL